jgi:SRSO17 transposase
MRPLRRPGNAGRSRGLGSQAAERRAQRGQSDAVLIADETSDVKSPADCAGAARQYGGATGSVALRQVAVTLTYTVPAGHALIGRALYLPAGWAADEERRELAGVPGEIMLATKPELAGELLRQAHSRGIRAPFIAGDEVCGSPDLRKTIRELSSGYVMAVRPNHSVTLPSGRRIPVTTAEKLPKPGMWQRTRTGSAAKSTKDYHWAMIEITPDDTPPRDTTTAMPSCSCASTAIPAPSATTSARARGPSRWPS